jgi:hypothetical protein
MLGKLMPQAGHGFLGESGEFALLQTHHKYAVMFLQCEQPGLVVKSRLALMPVFAEVDCCCHVCCRAFSYNENADEDSLTAGLTGSSQALTRALSNVGGVVTAVLPGERTRKKFRNLFHKKRKD